MHERQFDWLTHVLPLEKLNIVQLLQQATHETQRNGTQRNPTEPQFSSAKDDVTPFKVNGDASTLPDQRIQMQPCACSVIDLDQWEETTRLESVWGAGLPVEQRFSEKMAAQCGSLFVFIGQQITLGRV